MLKLVVRFASLVIAMGMSSGTWAQEAFIKKTVEERLPGIKIEGVTKTPYFGLYEVRNSEAQLFYTDEKVTYIFLGSVLDGKNPDKDLTAERVRKLTAVKFDELPLSSAFKIVRGKGTRQIAYFSDPNCPYCRQLEKELLQLDDVTIHVLLYPILNPQDSPAKSRNVWCSPDRAKAWNDLMLNGVQPAPAAAGCSAPTDQILAFGRKYRVNSVPTLFFTNGERVAGMRPAKDLKQMIDDAAKTSSLPAATVAVASGK